MVRQSIITLALLHEFVYEFRGNNTYIILDRTALFIIQAGTIQALDGVSEFPDFPPCSKI